MNTFCLQGGTWRLARTGRRNSGTLNYVLQHSFFQVRVDGASVSPVVLEKMASRWCNPKILLHFFRCNSTFGASLRCWTIQNIQTWSQSLWTYFGARQTLKRCLGTQKDGQCLICSDNLFVPCYALVLPLLCVFTIWDCTKRSWLPRSANAWLLETMCELPLQSFRTTSNLAIFPAMPEWACLLQCAWVQQDRLEHRKSQSHQSLCETLSLTVQVRLGEFACIGAIKIEALSMLQFVEAELQVMFLDTKANGLG